MSIVYFLNVGRGDCSIIEHDSDRLTMIDINRIVKDKQYNTTNDLKESNFNSYFLGENSNPKGNFNQIEHPTDPIEFFKKNYPKKNLFRFILTHPDMDHLKGLKDLSDEIGFINFWSYQNTKDDKTIKDEDKEDWNFYQTLLKNKFLNLIDTNNCNYIPDDGLQILSPNEKLIREANEKGNWNDASATILYNTNGFKFLFCGDGGDETWEHLKNYKNEISNIDVFFAPHHGRKSDRNFDFLDIVKPRITILGNAESEYLAYDQYRDKSVNVFTNNQAGNFKFEIKDNKLEISFSNKNFAESFCKENDLVCTTKNDEMWYCIGILNATK